MIGTAQYKRFPFRVRFLLWLLFNAPGPDIGTFGLNKIDVFFFFFFAVLTAFLVFFCWSVPPEFLRSFLMTIFANSMVDDGSSKLVEIAEIEKN